MSLTLYENELKIGAEKPFSIIQMSDIHLTFSDERDPEEIRTLSQKRKDVYPGSAEVLDEIGKLSDETGSMIISTGDICDFISERNLEEVQRFTASHNAVYTPGNHDFRLRGGMAYDIPEIKVQSFGRVQEAYPNDLRSYSFEFNGVDFVLLDNVYYRFEEWQLKFLKNEVSKGLPVVVAMHIPLYEESLYMKTSRNLTRHASLVCVPPEKMSFYKPERIVQQTEDRTTRETYEYILSEPNIRCLLTGHSHKDHEAMLNDHLIQYTTGLHTVRIIGFC